MLSSKQLLTLALRAEAQGPYTGDRDREAALKFAERCRQEAQVRMLFEELDAS